MAEEKETLRREEKLKGYDNWSRWSNITKLALKEKGLWTLANGQRTGNGNAASQTAYEKDAAAAAKIIKSGVNDELFKNIEDTDDPKAIWDRLEKVCTQVGQGVVYAGLRELLLHPAAAKAEGHEKSINNRFAEVKSLIHRIKSAVATERNVWDDIALITILEGLPEEYDAKKEGLLNQKLVTVDDAQQILGSEEVRIKATR